MRIFTPEKPPKSGKSKKLWDWWIKHQGKPPKELALNQPGKHQRSEGTPNYFLVPQGSVTPYLIWDVNKIIALTPSDAVYSQRAWILK